MAKVWKNGTAIILSDGTKDNITSAVTVEGNDVYTAGAETLGVAYTAKYWKNTTAVYLTDGVKNTEVASIAVAGNDIYAAGYAIIDGLSVAKYWKNGKSVEVAASSGFGTRAYGMFLTKN